MATIPFPPWHGLDGGSGMKQQLDGSRSHYDASYYRGVYAGFADDDFARLWARGCLAVMGLEDRDHAAVLEFGAGLGQNLAAIRAGEKWAVDINPQSRVVCEERGLRWRDSLDAVPDGIFDLVLARHSLEHVESPAETLRALRRKIRRDGLLFLVVPIETIERPENLAHYDEHRHLFSWTPLTLKNLLLATGWRPRALDVHSGRWFRRSLSLLNVGTGAFLTFRKLVTRLTPLRSAEIVAVCVPDDGEP